MFRLIFWRVYGAFAPPIRRRSKPGPAKEEFKKIHAEFNAINAELRISASGISQGVEVGTARPWRKNGGNSTARARRSNRSFCKPPRKPLAKHPTPIPKLPQLMLNIFSLSNMPPTTSRTPFRLGKLVIDNEIATQPPYWPGRHRGRCDRRFRPRQTSICPAAERQGVFKKLDSNKKPATGIAAVYLDKLSTPLKEKREQEQQIREAEAKADDLAPRAYQDRKGDIDDRALRERSPEHRGELHLAGGKRASTTA